MYRHLIVVAVLLSAVSATWTAMDAAGPQAAPAARISSTSAASPQQYRATIDKYCVTCHNQRLKAGEVALDQLDMAAVPANAQVWERVVRKLRTGMMPPANAPRPDLATYDALSTSLETSLDQAMAGKPYAGRPMIRRLNRTEYANAIRDLLDLEVDATALLPADDNAYGFDNNGDALGVAPVLMERYLSAAGKISQLAVGDPAMAPGSDTFRIRQDVSQHEHLEGLPLGTVGGVHARTFIPLDGEYVIKAKLIRTNLAVTRGLENEREVEFSVDGERVHVAKFGGPADNKVSFENPTLAGDDVDSRLQVRVALKAGPRNVGVAFIKRSDIAYTNRLQPYIRSSQDPSDITGMPQIQFVSITGPFNATGVGDTPSRRRIFMCTPTNAAAERPCATKILSTLARRAYRRTPTDAEVTRLMEFYDRGRTGGASFDKGITMGLDRLLASPNFVFRPEPVPAGLTPGSSYEVGDNELATRLSFFLWSSIPDDQLLDVAAQGRLKNPTVLAQQVKRMVADPKAALVTNFADQWLWLRNLDTFVPTSDIFPDFDDNLRQSMRKETELLFDSIIREDRSVLDLLNADYTFANERLAKHYGIKNVYGDWFRRVPVPQDERRGLLGQASLLAVTSHADRTSPVVRGKWLLENLLGAEVPPPPPNVPPLKETDGRDAGAARTMRDRMVEHRNNPVCASCHAILDPVGLTLENFDAVGAYRTTETGEDFSPKIDASGEVLGTKVNGVTQVREAMLAHKEQFVRTLTEKLMIYALGRGLDYADMPTVRQIVRDAAPGNYKFSSLLMGVIKSAPFRRAVVPQPATVASAAR